MPDEVGTKTTRSDAPNATVVEEEGDAATPAIEEDISKGETAQDPQGSAEASDEAGLQEELKVVVSIKGGRATIGVQQPSSDPHIESFDDPDLSGLAQEVLAVTERARASWEDAPKHSAHVRSAPPRRQRRRQQGTAQATTAEGGVDRQPPETPRLF